MWKVEEPCFTSELAFLVSQEGLEGPCLNSLKGDAEKREMKKRKRKGKKMQKS